MAQQVLTASQKQTAPQVPSRAPRPASAQPFQGRSHPLLQLHRTVGNQRVAQLIQARRLTPDGKAVDGAGREPANASDHIEATSAAVTAAGSSLSVQRKCPACAAHERDEKNSAGAGSTPTMGPVPVLTISRSGLADKVSPAAAGNCQCRAQRQAGAHDEEEKKKTVSAKLVDSAVTRYPRVQRKEDTGTDGDDYVKLAIPDGTYVLEEANIPADASYSVTYTNFADVYATASQFLPLAKNGLMAAPHTIYDTRGKTKETKFKVKPGPELDPQAGWGSVKLQAFRHGYVFDEDVMQAYLQFDTVSMLENPGKEEFVAHNVIDLNPENHEGFVCPEQGKMTLSRETAVTVTDGVVVSKTKSVEWTVGGDVTLKFGGKDDWFHLDAKFAAQRKWATVLGTTVSQQVAVAKKLQVNYACEGPGDFAFVPSVSVWKTPLTMNVADKTGKRTSQETAYLYRLKYSPNAMVCKVVNGKVDPTKCGQKAAGAATADPTAATATAAAPKSVLDLSPDEFEKDQEAQFKLFTMAKSCRYRMQELGQKILTEQLITGGEVTSILKRDGLPEFVKGVVDKCRRNGYKRVGDMDDIVRGRFDLRSNEDVNTVAAALRAQTKYPVVSAVAPQRPQASGGYGYPRWHLIVKDPDTGITHEWQVGTKAVTEVFEKSGIKMPDGVKKACPNLKNDLHDVEYDIFKGIYNKYRDVHERHGLPAFHAATDAVAAEAGLKGEKTPDLAKKIKKLHEDAGTHLQKLVDEFGADWIKQFCH